MTQIKISDPNLLTPSDFSKVRMELFEQISGSTYKVRYAAALTFLQLAIDAVSGGASVGYDTLKKIEDNVRDIWDLINSGELGGGDIRTISLDGENLPIDENKNVDIELIGKYLKTVTSDTTLQGDGTPTNPLSLGTFTPGRLVVVNTDGSLLDIGELTWDSVNKRLGLNKTTPLAPLHLKALSATYGGALRIEQSNSTALFWELVPVGGALMFLKDGYLIPWTMASNAFYSGNDLATSVNLLRTNGASWFMGGNVGFNTRTPTKLGDFNGTAGYVASGNEGTTDLDFASRKTSKTFGKQSLTTKAPVITVWASSDYRDGQIKTTKAEYYNETTRYYEQRFDWNEDFSVKRIEIKDDITGLWVQRNYTWTDGIPSVSESTITAWTI